MRRIFSTLFSLSFLVLVGCNNNNTDNANSIANSIDTSDTAEAITSTVTELQYTPEEYMHVLFSELQQANFDNLMLPQEIISEIQNSQDSDFIHILQSSIANLEYNILDVVIEDDIAVAITQITTSNLEHIFELALFSAFEELVPSFLNEGIYIEDIAEDVLENIFVDIYNSGDGGTVTNIVSVNLVQLDDEWRLSEDNLPFINALTGNLYSFLENMHEFIGLFNEISMLDLEN